MQCQKKTLVCGPKIYCSVSIMKKALLILITGFLFSFSQAAAGGLIVLEGSYQGKNLFVSNPFASNGVGFCTTEVLVNDVTSTDEIQSSAFEIDLSNYRLKLGDKVVIKIKHKDDCKPRVLNPEVLKPTSTCEYLSVKVDDNTIKWTTKGESGSLPFVIEQKFCSKWIKVGEVAGKGSPDAHEYSFKVKHHSGVNEYRIVQTDYAKSNQSTVYKYRSKVPEVTFFPARITKDINFSDETMYEIFDMQGEIKRRGVAKMVDISDLPKGQYIMNYDNRTTYIIKK